MVWQDPRTRRSRTPRQTSQPFPNYVEMHTCLFACFMPRSYPLCMLISKELSTVRRTPTESSSLRVCPCMSVPGRGGGGLARQAQSSRCGIGCSRPGYWWRGLAAVDPAHGRISAKGDSRAVGGWICCEGCAAKEAWPTIYIKMGNTPALSACALTFANLRARNACIILQTQQG